MPTIEQLNRTWLSGFNNDDRIGIGGFEAPNGRQWWEPARQFQMPEYTGTRIGYFIYDFEKQTERFITDFMLEDYTDTDDQDWQDFKTTNKNEIP